MDKTLKIKVMCFIRTCGWNRDGYCGCPYLTIDANGKCKHKTCCD